ncbi:hypothetical protein ACOME3_001974 [Neoechinorhynchus agilis]
MACAIVPVYINEISSKKIRGSVGVMHEGFITIGIFLAQVIAFGLAGYRTWVYGMTVVTIPCLIAHCMIPILPDSPEQLILVKDNDVEGIKALRRLRGVEDVSADIALIQSSSSSESSNEKVKSIMEMINSTQTKWAVITSLAILTVQALSGINAIFFYSSKVFKTAGINDDNLPYANASTGLLNVLPTLVAVYLIEKAGRKALLIYPMTGMLFVFVGLTATIQLNESRQSAALGIVSVLLTLIFICLFAVGLGPIGFIYPNEVIRQSSRDSVLRAGLCLNYAGNLLISLLFPAINAVLRGYSFMLFFTIVAMGLGLLLAKMPETKNKTVEEIERFWLKSKTIPHEQTTPFSVSAKLRQSEGPTV